MAHSSPDRKRQRRDSPAHSVSNQTQAPNAPLFSVPSARWCSIAGHGTQQPNVTWDESKIKCLLTEEEQSDAVLMQSLVDGSNLDLASKFHPLIFDAHSGTESATLRSLPFFRKLVSGDRGVLDDYRSWSKEKKRIVALGVRDLYLAAVAGLLVEGEKGLLRNLVDVVEEPSPGGYATVEGMTVSFHPSASFRMIKFVEDLNSKLDPEWGPYFAQVLDIPRLYAVFVDQAELSFHNFENIIPLDRWMEAKLPQEPQKEGVVLEIADIKDVEPGQDVWTVKLRGASVELLKELATLDLFVAPLNKATRGGERFIFHSAILSKALTSTISSSGLLPRLAGGSIPSSDFAFVNYVFRCNRFTPGDAKFAAHRDTPYYDAARSQVSKYTLLIYLSSGRNPGGALEVNGTNLTDIDEFTCVIFDQRHEHEGRPFVDTDKIFLRTELVFNDKELSADPKIASLFSEACYMTGQSVFGEELASYAHECFERANSLHWAVEKQASEPPVYLYKQYLGFKFLTNGYDYWFANGASKSTRVRDCAVIAVMDYLNCKIGDLGPFRSLCRSTTIREDITSTADAFRLMHSPESTPDHHASATKLRHLDEYTIQSLFKTQSDTPFTKRPRPEWIDEEDDSDPEEGCCPFHCWMTFDAWESKEVAKHYAKCRKFTRNKLFGTPLVFLGEEMVINEKQIEVRGDKILFHVSNPEKESTRFNFAACWGDSAVGAEVYVDVDREVPAPKLLVPPITFHEYEGQGCHLTMDFFRNDWMVRVNDDRKIAVPVITNDVSDEFGEEDIGGPFWEKVKELAGGVEEEFLGSYWDWSSEGEMTDDEE
ncbi:hypothetical protein B0T16DRAFT_387706 [Cercophora newfieldiana]|uniref:Uncharacterized protein n=1 Tax=Cercophora newfieldiana TaxID=92897 RepID=A0AA40CVS5_9PEZI|nr:hypothetical protein B0T16DRAFT_387706 [Cercophora newfieldiana]